jgi:hypothetical protein
VRSFRWLRLRLPQPWSRRLGQLAYLPRLARGHEETRRAFSEEALIERLVAREAPLERIGLGMSERVVEIPWVLACLAADLQGTVLDVGTAFSPVVYQRLLLRRPNVVETVDLADVAIAGIRSHVADIRELPFAADSFDVAVCVSTLEHIGMDNTQYDIESGGGGDLDALRELGRVARRVLITVPGGADENMGWQRQYSPGTFRRLVADAGLQIDDLRIFTHDPASGWVPAEESAVEGRAYGRGAVAAAASICADLRRP